MNQAILDNLANASICLLEENMILPALFQCHVDSTFRDILPSSANVHWVEMAWSLEQQQQLSLQQQIDRHIRFFMQSLGRMIDDTLCDYLITKAKEQDAFVRPFVRNAKNCLQQAACDLQAPQDYRHLVLTPKSEVEMFQFCQQNNSLDNTYLLTILRNYNLFFHQDAVKLTVHRPISKPQEAWVETEHFALRLSAKEESGNVILRFTVPLSISDLKPGYCVLIAEDDFCAK